jgi:hypothetical protein
MRQAELDRAVARATQESVGVIRNMGFSLMEMPLVMPVTAYRRQPEPKPVVTLNEPRRSNMARRRAV